MKKSRILSEFPTTKFVVIKNKDIEQYLAPKDAEELRALIRRLYVSKKCNKNDYKENLYLVVNMDEPYAEEVAEIMKQYGHNV